MKAITQAICGFINSHFSDFRFMNIPKEWVVVPVLARYPGELHRVFSVFGTSACGAN
jgi:hypothetical protein